jgi:phage tail protein X
MDYLVHQTKDGDRWDLLAWHYYGDALRFEVIVVANPHVPIVPILDAGLQLAIPILVEEETVAAEDLPPWKQP